MKPEKLRSLIDEIMWDIEFDYQGKHGAICCFAEDSFSVCYDGKEKDYTSADDVMTDTELFGKPLEEIAEELEMYQEW